MYIYQFYKIYRFIAKQSVCVLDPNECLLIQGEMPSCLEHPTVLNLSFWISCLGLLEYSDTYLLAKQ